MASTIYLVRHAESEHNISKDFSQHDPPLTTLGHAQAANLVSTFPNPERIAVVITSPLRRAIQTSLAGFSHVLDKRYFDQISGSGIEHGVTLTLEPGLQERSAMPCDSGSHRSVLEKEFLNLDLEQLDEHWQSKSGQYAADDDSVTIRARTMRENLKRMAMALRDKKRRDIVVVTHGVFMKYLSVEDIDLPKAGWKSYTFESNEEDKATTLIPVEDKGDQ
jgi:broad specificity phosphatase PhoE